jgi:site-specific DNA-adenine methylase
VTRDSTSEYCDAEISGSRATEETAAEAFVFCDPPYVLSERASGKIYDCELSDEDHRRFLEVVTAINASRYRLMVCGYSCQLYASLQTWSSIDHRVPNYQYIGDGRRSRERIRRRQKNWQEQLRQMSEQERLAMLEVLNS